MRERAVPPQVRSDENAEPQSDRCRYYAALDNKEGIGHPHLSLDHYPIEYSDDRLAQMFEDPSLSPAGWTVKVYLPYSCMTQNFDHDSA